MLNAIESMLALMKCVVRDIPIQHYLSGSGQHSPLFVHKCNLENQERFTLKFFRNQKAFGTFLEIAIIIAVVAAAVAGVYMWYSTGASKAKTMNFTDFTAVDVGSAFKVSIAQSNSYSVVITASEGIFNRIEVTQTGNTLTIDIKAGFFTGPLNAVAKITIQSSI